MLVTKPPLGWNTWNTFAENINEELILESAEAMIHSGLRDAGYEYIVIDDTWALKERDKSGHLVADPKKFPHGIGWLADEIHKRGFKFGIYSCAGYRTCASYPGSYGHEWDDAKTFADWKVDFLKYDFCYRATSVKADVLYKRMGLALRNCGRDIVFSACSWGIDNTRQWIKETGAHMWRSTADIFDNWASIKSIAQSQVTALEYNGHCCFNDMDMLVVGMHGRGHVGLKGCTAEEYRLHFSLWALLNSPLMIGCDIRNMDDETKEILLNKDIIAINQDGGAYQPYFINMYQFVPNENRKSKEPFFKEYPVDMPMIARFLDNGDIAIGIFNLGEEELSPWDNAVAPDVFGLTVESGKRLELKNLWTGEVIPDSDGVIIPKCPPHSCIMYRAKLVDRKQGEKNDNKS